MDTSDDLVDDNTAVLGHRDAIQIINAEDKPFYSYNMSRKVFEPEQRDATFFSEVQQKVEVFRDRYKMIYQKVMRGKQFNPTDPNAISLTSIDSLLGSRGSKYIMGLITRKSADIYQIEDLNGVTQVDISESVSFSSILFESLNAEIDN